jgi:hypothetical protein
VTLRFRRLVIKRNISLAGAFAVAAVVVLFAAADRTSASITTTCNTPEPTGRLFCLTVEDRDGVSPTGTTGSGNIKSTVQAYQFYKLTIGNAGGSSLTNGVATLKLTDLVPGSPAVNSTAVFVPSGSASFCSRTSSNPNLVTCQLGNLAAGAALPPFFVAYRTSNTPNVSSTNAEITVGFKESAKRGANPSSLTYVENTSLEPDPELSVSWSPPGQHVDLGTAPDPSTAFSKFSYDVPTGKTAFLSTLGESNEKVCAPELSDTCFGQLVRTDVSGAAAGTFSAANPFHLTILVSTDIAPGGTNGLAISHQFDDGSFEVIRTQCSSSPPSPSDTLPCFIVGTLTDKDTKAKFVTFDIWGFRNGGWMPGG